MDEEIYFKIGETIRYVMIKNTKIFWEFSDIKFTSENNDYLELLNGMKLKFIEKISSIWSLYNWQGTEKKILIQNKM